MSSPYWPFVTLAVSVAFIIVGISKLRLHAFIALLAAALIAGLMTGKDAWEIGSRRDRRNGLQGPW